MGRKAVDKVRSQNPAKRAAIAMELMPILESRGLDGLTMDDLASLVNRSKATIYKYFTSREELFDLSLTMKLDQIRAFVPILNDSTQPFLERYYRAIQLLSAHLATISNDFLADLRRLYPRLWKKVEMLQEFAGMILHQYYAEGVERGILAAIHPGILVLSDRFLFQALSDPDFLEAQGLTIREAFEEYFRMKFFGIVQRESAEENGGAS